MDKESGRLILNSPFTSEEYRDLINEKKLDLKLTDLKRDPETGVLNPKSMAEYCSTIECAKEHGIIKGEVRRPKTYLGEREVNYVSQDGSKKYEIKEIVKNKFKSYEDSAKDIIENIREKNKKVEKLPA